MFRITLISISILVTTICKLGGIGGDPLGGEDPSNIFVTFGHGITPVIQGLNLKTFTSRADRVTSLTEALKANARASQEKVLSFLSSAKTEAGLSITSYWISNQLNIKGATPELIERIRGFDGVSRVGAEANYYLDAPTEVRSSPRPSADEIQWGVKKVEAPEAWTARNGNNGTGILVGTIDSGARVTHETLSHNYVGDYGWFDPYQGEESPLDEAGHGTHTLATIVGSHGVGVAPGAKWMTCRGCYKGFCTAEALLACGQFLLCPTDVKGQNPDCSRAPHIASNSFGGGQGRDLLWPVFDAWEAAGILIVFSNGNSGPWCGTANSHADSPQVIGVGGTASDDTLYVRSSVGPSVYGTLKPDIAAPGVDVLSAYHLADDSYYTMSGTSMAAPHVAGAIAILLGQRAGMSLDEVKELLSEGSEKKLGLTGQNCGGIREDEFPNHAYGGGRISVLRSLQLLQSETS